MCLVLRIYNIIFIYISFVDDVPLEPLAQVTDQIKDDLRAFFKPHNEDLEELLGNPIPDAWK